MCDRSFPTPLHLEKHRIKRRHWLCNCCDKMFNSVMQLEHHKEMHGHWSDDEYDTSGTEESDEDENGNMMEDFFEEETIFGPDEEKTILLCSQF